MSLLSKEVETAMRAECEQIVREFYETPKPAYCMDCDEPDLYQERLEYNWFREEQQNRLDELKEQLNEPKIQL